MRTGVRAYEFVVGCRARSANEARRGPPAPRRRRRAGV